MDAVTGRNTDIGNVYIPEPAGGFGAKLESVAMGFKVTIPDGDVFAPCRAGTLEYQSVIVGVNTDIFYADIPASVDVHPIVGEITVVDSRNAFDVQGFAVEVVL
jgi:hypothetical protein